MRTTAWRWYAQARDGLGRVRLDAAALRRIRDIRSIANYQRWLPKLLIIVGSGLLVYVGTSYAQMLLEQRQLASEFQREQSPKARRVSIDADISRLRVPKIDLDSYIVEGVSRHAMSLGIGHMRDTVEPGEAGNAVLSAHR